MAHEFLTGALVWDTENGEGEVVVPEELFEEPLLTQLDALRDWSNQLITLYNDKLKAYEKENLQLKR